MKMQAAHRGRAAALALLLLATACGKEDSGDASSSGASDRELAEHYAPVFHQDINQNDGAAGVSDLPLRFDYDGDWNGANNWDDFSYVKSWQKNGQISPGGGNPGGYDLGAWVYYSVVETERHWFITYAVFHPRDWDDSLLAAFGSTHENDLEGALVVVEKDGTRHGKLLCLETQAHEHFLLYTNLAGVTARGAAPIRGGVLFTGSRPRCYIEAEGHGIASGTTESEAVYASVLGVVSLSIQGIYLGEGGPTSDFRGGDGFVFEYAGAAQCARDPALGLDPSDPADRTVGYDLRSMDELWDRRGSSETMMNFKTFQGTRFAGSAAIGFSFNDADSGQANPPWGWVGEDVEQGDFFFDPAWTVWRQFDFGAYPGGFDRREDGSYLRHRYLDEAAVVFQGTP